MGTAGLLTLMLANEVYWQVYAAIPGAWAEAATSAVPGILALMICRFRHRPAWPVPMHPLSYRIFALALVIGQVLYLAAASMAGPGDPGTFVYIPLLNPFDLAVVFAGLTTALSLRIMRTDMHVLEESAVPEWLPGIRIYFAAAFLVLTTLALLRGVHHLAGVPWDFDRLYDSVIAQTALSIYWGILGFAGMLWGARRGARWLWLASAGFMGLVVLKLLLVDLGNSDTIERIVSFVGVGVLLLVVGYFAPAPPKHAEQAP
jgi:uncharacterized membrane protein